MVREVSNKLSSYLEYYSQFLSNSWRNLSPMEYAGLLIFIAFFGWVLMKSNLKR